MDILNLGGINEPSERPSKKKLKVIIGIGLLAGVMGMGSTLAASITLNGGTAVEFGQGVQLVTACDDAITVTPTSEFVNDTRTGQANFRLKTIALTGIGAGCVGKKIRLTAFTDVETYTAYTLAGSGAGNITSPLAFGYNDLVTGNKFLPSADAVARMAGCEITLATSAGSNTDPANMSTADSKVAASVACTLNSSTDDTTARTLTSTGTGALLLTFKTGETAGNIVQPILAAAISKFALESNA
jgi:hypothetical protein